MQLLIDKTTRQVTGYGEFPTPPADPNVRVVDLPPDKADAARALLQTPGKKTLGADNVTITVTPPDPASLVLPDPFPKRAAAIAALKAAAASNPVAQAFLDFHGIT